MTDGMRINDDASWGRMIEINNNPSVGNMMTWWMRITIWLNDYEWFNCQSARRIGVATPSLWKTRNCPLPWARMDLRGRSWQKQVAASWRALPEGTYMNLLHDMGHVMGVFINGGVHVTTFFGHIFPWLEKRHCKLPGMLATWPFLLVRCLPEGPGVLNSGTELIDIFWKKNIFWKASLTVYSFLSVST